MADKTNAQGYDPIKYGAKGEKTGYAKVGQARNQPGFVPRGQRDGVPNTPDGAAPTSAASYLTPEQQAKVDKLLGDSYDPTKPLNVQLFKAQWATMTPAQRQAFAKTKSGEFLEGGPKSKTLAGFHSEWLDALHEQTGGGFAQSQEQAQANIAYWKAFAATPEGQAHIAATGMTQDEWLKSTVGDMKEGLNNYQNQQQQFSTIQNLAQRLGMEVPGFVAPGWNSTLEGIKAGRGPLPSADYLAMYPGSAAGLVGVENTFSPQNQGRQASGNGEAAQGSGLFQPFTNFTGVQQPDTFSERDLYQETQYR
jgi:hypothetical protein